MSWGIGAEHTELNLSEYLCRYHDRSKVGLMNMTKKDKTATAPSTDSQPSPPNAELALRPPEAPDQIEQPDEPTPQGLRETQDLLEHHLWEMEAKLSHEFSSMHAKLDSGFSRLSDKVSDLGDTLDDSVDRLEKTVDRFTSTMRWYLALAAVTALVGIAFLIWQIFFAS